MIRRIPLVILLFICNNSFVRGACEVEADLDFESCDLKHLTDSALAVSGHLIQYCLMQML